MRNINQSEFEELSINDDYVILDVRRPDECASGQIPNAFSINLMDRAVFSTEIEKLDKRKHYLVYCKSGNRSGVACQIMDAIGFGNTYNLKGGMMGWGGAVV